WKFLKQIKMIPVNHFYKHAAKTFIGGPVMFKRHLVCHAILTIIVFITYYQLNGGLLPSFLRGSKYVPHAFGGAIPIPKSRPDVDILEHFLQAEGDGSKITWAHAVNSKSKLDDAVKSDVMMMEADILLRGQDTDQQQLVPIMAHPPDKDSDITFAEWLDIGKTSTKGLKLDFKSIEAVELTLQNLKKVAPKLRMPIWLNADILKGPNSKSNPVDAERFLKLCSEMFPKSTISLGWTVSLEGKERQYSWAHVIEMYHTIDKWILKKRKQPVTIAVAACCIKYSIPQLKWLTDMTGASLTLWSHESHLVQLADTLYTQYKFPKNKLYFDLAQNHLLQINQHRGDKLHVINPTFLNKEVFKPKQWKVMTGEKNTEPLHIGEEAVVLGYNDFMLVSINQHIATTTSPVVINGHIQFMDPKPDPKGEHGLEIYIRAPYLRYKTKGIPGIRCFLGRKGYMKISLENMPGEKTKFDDQLLLPNNGHCYQFSILDDAGTLNFHVKVPEDCLNPVDKNSKGFDKTLSIDLTKTKILAWDGYVIVSPTDTSVIAGIDELRISQ
ncbi:unnamed protein product, partial [Owenia fusiformis]